MRTVLLALAATAACVTGASAADYGPIRTRVYVAPVPYPPGMDADEVRDHQMEMVERRQEAEREALRFSQRVERRWIDPDDD